MGKLKTDIISSEVRINANEAQKELNKLAQNTSKLTNENARLRQEKTRLELAEKKDTKAIKKLNEMIAKNNLIIKRNKFRMEELHKVVGLASLSKTQLTKKSRSLQRQLDATSKSANPKEYKRLSAELSAVNRQLNKVRRGASATQRIWNTAKGFGAGMLGAFSVTKIVSGIADFTRQIFDLTVKMEGDARRASIVFGDSLGYVERQAAKLSKKMGVTTNEFIAATAATADLLIPLDFSREQSAEMAVQLQSLTGALDEWTAGQIGASEVSAILTKAMLGENEQLKRLGIAIRKDSEEFRSLVKQKLATTNATKAQAEAMATLELIQKKSADAQRSYIAEGNKLQRALKALRLWYKNLKEGVAEFFQIDQATKLRNEQAEINGVARALMAYNGNQEKRVKYIQQMEAIYPEFFRGLNIEKITNEQIEERLKGVNTQYRERIRLANIQKQLDEKDAEIIELDNAQMKLEKGMSQQDVNLTAAAVAGEVSYDDLIAKSEKNWKKKTENISLIEKAAVSVVDIFIDANNDSLKRWVEIQKKREKLNKERSELIGAKPADIDSNTTADPVFENINKKIINTRQNIRQLKQDLADLRSGKKQSSDLKGDITKKETAIKEQESLLATYTGKNNTVTPNATQTASEIEQWKEKAKELLVQAQQELAVAKIAAMSEGYEKEKAKEEQRWKEEKTALEAQLIEKSDKQKELLPEQLEANAVIHKLIEAQESAHLQKMKDLKAAHKDEEQLKKTEDDLLRLEEDMLRAEEEESAFEDKMSLIQQRYDIEFAAAEGNRKRELEAKRKFNAAVDKIQEEQHRKEELRKKATEGLAEGLFSNMKAMAKKGAALSKAFYLFEQAMAIRQVIVNTQIANSKAVASSPLTAGMPWVGINTALGAASVGFILAQTAAEFKGKEEGGYIDVRREQDGKPFRAKYKPNHRGYTAGPTVITGENGMEFVANAKAAQNPTIRPFLDVIDKAQRQGTIETLDLTAIRAEKYRGFASGGYLSSPPESVFDDDVPSGNKEQADKFEQVMELVQQLATRPIEFSLVRFDETRQLQEEIDNDVNR